MHFGPGGLRELDGRDAHTARRGVHQHPFARAQRPIAVQRRPRGRVVDGHGGALLEAQCVGDRHRVGGRDVDDVGVATESRSREHPFADAARVDAIANGLDGPCDFVTDDRREFRRVRIQADTGEMIGEVHSRRAHGDPQLTGAWRGRIRPLLDL